MHLRSYVEDIQRRLVESAEAGGDESRALVQRLVVPLDAAIRLALQGALAEAAEEITVDLAPGSVELRLRGGELQFAVTAPPVDAAGEGSADVTSGPEDATATAPEVEGDDGGMARINLRLPEQLKARVERAAAREGLSTNAWLVRAASSAVERVNPGRRQVANLSNTGQRYTGWAR
jgi:HicB family